MDAANIRKYVCPIKNSMGCPEQQIDHRKHSVQTPYESGAGYFSTKFVLSQNVIQHITPAVLDCIRSFPVKPGAAFNIAEYGCADGGTSMPLMYACVEELRNLYGDKLEIKIDYEDKPNNDFTSLFYFLQGVIQGPPSYLSDFANVLVSASGTSFYEQCFPSNSISFGFSCLAVQWLSKKPCDLMDSLYPQFSDDQNEVNAYMKQAEMDWERFLLMRAKELSPGGRLALIVAAGDADQENGDQRKSVLSYQGLLGGMFKVWKTMANDKIITENDVKEASFAEYFRSREEMLAPFLSEESLVKKAGLTLVSLEMKLFPSAQKKAWDKTGDIELAAKAAAEDTRAWSNASLMSALGDQRSQVEKTKIVDEFFRRLEVEFVQSHEVCCTDFCQALIIIEKKNDQ